MSDTMAVSVAEITERTRRECAALERASGPLGPADFDYGDVDASDDEGDLAQARPAIVLMGLKRSGKTSIRKVVFQKMSPNETLFVESTEDYNEALKRLCDYVVRAYKLNAGIRFEVFVHKVDGLTDDQKMEIQRDIYQRANDDLVDLGYDNIHLSFHLTSIYDHSIFEAFSKVVQKLIPQLPTLEQLLDIFNQNSHVEKSFLFDVSSKIYVATDATPVSMEVYELCCDMIDVAVDIACIYGLKDDGQPENDSAANMHGDGVANHEQLVSSVGLGGSLAATIKLHNRVDDAAPMNGAQVLYLRQVNDYLALVCIGRSANMDKQGLMDYNFKTFRDAIGAVFEVRRKMLLTARHKHRERRQQRSKLSNASSSTGAGGAAPPHTGTHRLRHASRDTAESTTSS